MDPMGPMGMYNPLDPRGSLIYHQFCSTLVTHFKHCFPCQPDPNRYTVDGRRQDHTEIGAKCSEVHPMLTHQGCPKPPIDLVGFPWKNGRTLTSTSKTCPTFHQFPSVSMMWRMGPQNFYKFTSWPVDNWAMKNPKILVVQERDPYNGWV